MCRWRAVRVRPRSLLLLLPFAPRVARAVLPRLPRLPRRRIAAMRCAPVSRTAPLSRSLRRSGVRPAPLARLLSPRNPGGRSAHRVPIARLPTSAPPARRAPQRPCPRGAPPCRGPHRAPLRRKPRRVLRPPLCPLRQPRASTGAPPIATPLRAARRVPGAWCSGWRSWCSCCLWRRWRRSASRTGADSGPTTTSRLRTSRLRAMCPARRLPISRSTGTPCVPSIPTWWRGCTFPTPT